MAQETEPRECPLSEAKQPEMYRIWYQILIKKACHVAKGITMPRPNRQNTQNGETSAVAHMDTCLDLWAANLTGALCAPDCNWNNNQYEAVYVQLWNLVRKTWKVINRRNTENVRKGQNRRKELVESVVRELRPACSGACALC